MSRLPIRLAAIAALSLGSAACRDEPFSATRPGAVSIRVEPAVLTLAVGREARLEAVVVDRAGRAVQGAELFFRSDRPQVIEVSPTGTMRALSSGTATVTAYHGRLRTPVQITVPDASGELATFSLLVGSSDRSLSVETWSLSDVYLPFAATGRNGESLCGRVPLSFGSDSLVARAEPPPALGDPCRIRIVPRGAGNTWLMVQAGTFVDSVRVFVFHRRYRAILEQLGPGWDQPRMVGSTVRYRFTSIDEQGNGVPGLSLSFNARGILSATTATTDSQGQATVEWRLPTTLPGDGTFPSLGRALFGTTGRWPDGTFFFVSDVVIVTPDRPAGFAFMNERGFAAGGRGNLGSCGWELSGGDTIRLPAPVFFFMAHCNNNRLRISLGDQYGNPVGGDADIEVTADYPDAITGRTVVSFRSFARLEAEPTLDFPVVQYSVFTAIPERPWARGVRLTIRAPNAPAIPPRTIVVVPYCNGCP